MGTAAVPPLSSAIPRDVLLPLEVLGEVGPSISSEGRKYEAEFMNVTQW